MSLEIGTIKDELHSSVNFAIETATEAKSLIADNKDLIKDLTVKYEKLNLSVLQLSKRNKELEAQVNRNEQYSRKTNLIFTCYQQPNDDCVNIVKHIFNIMKLPNIIPEKCQINYCEIQKSF